MKLGEKYMSGHTGSEILKVVQTFKNRMVALKIGDSDRRIMASGSQDENNLCLAHVPRTETTLTKIEKGLWTDD